MGIGSVEEEVVLGEVHPVVHQRLVLLLLVRKLLVFVGKDLRPLFLRRQSYTHFLFRFLRGLLLFGEGDVLLVDGHA